MGRTVDEDLAPWKHVIVESMNENAILHRTNPRVVLYGCVCLTDRRPASLLRATVADGPHPPLVDNTIGVKEPCSTSMILCAKLMACPPWSS